MKWLPVLPVLLATLHAGSLFDGKSLDGWQIRKGEEPWWRVEDGCIVGGSLERKVPHNTFITAPKRYANFELTLEVKLTGKNPNAGIQIRSERMPDHHEMIDYQADVGVGYWGKLYDESRRRKVIGDYVDARAATAVKEGWNTYRIRCEGPRVRLWLNGVLTVDYEEKDPDIPRAGLIGLQAHSGAPFEVRYRQIEIEELP
jgi:hypothetical protein